MQIVIEIEDDAYRMIKEGNLSLRCFNEAVYSVQKGKPLKDIETKIQDRAYEEDVVNFAKGMLVALDIMDRELRELYEVDNSMG